MINISEDIITQMLEKEIKEQVEKLMKTKRVDDIIREVVKSEVCSIANMCDVAKEVYNSERIKEWLVEKVANHAYKDILSTLNKKDDDWDDDDY